MEKCPYCGSEDGVLPLILELSIIIGMENPVDLMPMFPIIRESLLDV